MTRDGRKYVCLERQPLMLYNLNDDPFELANHALNPHYRAQRRRFWERLAPWIAATGDSFELPPLG